MSKKLTTEDLTKRAVNVHGDRYEYHLVEYIDSKSKVNIICKEHGVFSQTPAAHFKKQGCYKFLFT